jgi:hypothetical protein
VTVAAIFPDPEAALVNHLKAVLTATVSTTFPQTAIATPHVQVELEAGNDDDYPVTERAQVRVTCHGPSSYPSGSGKSSRTEVKALASLARAHAVTLRSADVSGVFPAGGRSSVITDPDTRNLMVWFLVRVDLKATLLAS